MDEQKENNQSAKEYVTNPEVLSKIDSEILLMTLLYIYGKLDHSKPMAGAERLTFCIGRELNSAIECIESAAKEVKHIDNMLVVSNNNDINDCIAEASIMLDDALYTMDDIFYIIDCLSSIINDYEYVLEDIITNHYPGIPKSIEKARLIKELQ